MANETKRRWVAKDGSIFVEKADPVKMEHQKKPIFVQEPIAFNIGSELANYIVGLHNARLFEATTASGKAHVKAVEAIRAASREEVSRLKETHFGVRVVERSTK
jgi:5-methylthioribose kinase